MIDKRIFLRISVFALCILALIGCSTNSSEEDLNSGEPDTRAEEIVQQSITVHGGLAKWQSLKSISYTKTIILYDSSGTKESKITQYHSYRLKPALSGVIWWMTESDTLTIAYANDVAVRSKNSIPDQSLEGKTAATKSFLSSYYVLFQPFKLKDKGTSLTYIGEGTLEDGTEVNIVQPVYEGAKEGDDRWWYYFDKKTNKLVANMVNHPPTFKLINTLVYDNSTDLLLNTLLKGFFVDSLRNVDYLRADYYYSNYKVEYLD